MVKHSLVKHATPAPEWTKGGGSYEKVGRVAVRGGSPCDRSCHLGDESITTAKHHQGGMQGGKFPYLSLLPPSISYQCQPLANQCGSQRARGPGGTVCRGQLAGKKGRVEWVESMPRRAEGDTHHA